MGGWMGVPCRVCHLPCRSWGTILQDTSSWTGCQLCVTYVMVAAWQALCHAPLALSDQQQPRPWDHSGKDSTHVHGPEHHYSRGLSSTQLLRLWAPSLMGAQPISPAAHSNWDTLES